MAESNCRGESETKRITLVSPTRGMNCRCRQIVRVQFGKDRFPIENLCWFCKLKHRNLSKSLENPFVERNRMYFNLYRLLFSRSLSCSSNSLSIGTTGASPSFNGQQRRPVLSVFLPYSSSPRRHPKAPRPSLSFTVFPTKLVRSHRHHRLPQEARSEPLSAIFPKK